MVAAATIHICNGCRCNYVPRGTHAAGAGGRGSRARAGWAGGGSRRGQGSGGTPFTRGRRRAAGEWRGLPRGGTPLPCPRLLTLGDDGNGWHALTPRERICRPRAACLQAARGQSGNFFRGKKRRGLTDGASRPSGAACRHARPPSPRAPCCPCRLLYSISQTLGVCCLSLCN